MDWNVGGETATVTSLRDGSASLYTTFTLGIIGGQAVPEVREAAIRFVRFAERFVESSEAVKAFPYPTSDKVFFYLLTYDGVRRVVGDESDMDIKVRTLLLFSAAQDVLYELVSRTPQPKIFKFE